LEDERNVTALFNLAVMHEEKGDKARAKDYYQEVLQKEPTHFKSKVNLAIILDKEGKSTEAHDFYQQALQ
jgi:Tfp pilus assembly protein PilF